MEIEHDEVDLESSLSSLERLQKSLRRWSDITPLLSATEKQIEMIHSRMVQRILYCLDYDSHVNGGRGPDTLSIVHCKTRPSVSRPC